MTARYTPELQAHLLKCMAEETAALSAIVGMYESTHKAPLGAPGRFKREQRKGEFYRT